MKRSKKQILGMFLVFTLILVSAAGYAAWNDFWKTTEESFFGLDFEISAYDNYGSKTLTIYGKNVHVGLLENSTNFSAEDSGFKSEVLEITLDGSQSFQVGNTVIFAESGLDVVKDFSIPQEMYVSGNGSSGFIPADRFVNDFQNLIGDTKTIIIASQMGVPICVYQGDSVFVTVPKYLPKMTRINIDGKSLYIHRANYFILDTELMGS